MPSVLAIISKAVFEKLAPEDVKLGDVIPTDRYVSNQPSELAWYVCEDTSDAYELYDSNRSYEYGES